MAVRLNGQGAPDLAVVLRAAGLAVDETAVPDWRNRSRAGNTSWYVDGRPTHVMVHHTASGAGSHDTLAKERAEARMLAITHSVRPVSNVYLGPSGTWYPLAGGPSNTNGEGVDVWGGGVPADSMNSYAVAIEAGNDGVGEPWTQLASYVSGVWALCAAYGINFHCVRGHLEWAPTRKIDPASDGNVNEFTTVGDRYGRFDMGRFRAAVAAHNQTPPPANPGDPVSGDHYLVQRNGTNAVYVTDLASFKHPVPWPGDDNPATPTNDLADQMRDVDLVLHCWNMNPETKQFWQLGEHWNEFLDSLATR